MKMPFAMLRDLVETRLTADQIGDLLTMAGFELEELQFVDGEPVLDVKVMANRGDGLSAMGLAREILAKDPDSRPTALYTRAVDRFRSEDEETVPAAPPVGVEILTEACTRYACRLFTNVQNGPSPEWLQKRLTQAGMRPISLLVDLTNYVLLEQGQPLHAFDYDKLHGGRIVVRDARQGEKLITLDGAEHDLSEAGMMMICDVDHPVAAAGIMGGLETEVGPETQTMLLESAHFSNTSVRRTRKLLGLSTEASYRFERWVDPNGVVAALNRFAELYSGIAGPDGVVIGLVDVYPKPFELPAIRVRMERVCRLLGTDVSEADAKRYLTSLGFGIDSPDVITQIGEILTRAVTPGAKGEFSARPPSWRPDVVREDDVIEEIGRVHGYRPDPRSSAPRHDHPRRRLRAAGLHRRSPREHAAERI